MSDSKSIRDVIADHVNDEVTNVSETPQAAPVQDSTPESKPAVEQSPTQETQETFAEKIEAKGLDPEKLDEIYSNYQKAYTKKRQKEKEELRKLQEEVKRYKEAASQGQVAPQAASTQTTQEQREAKRQFDLGNLSFEQYTETMRALMSEDARAIAQEEVKTYIARQQDESNQEQMLQRFNTLDERFDKKFIDPESPEYNQMNHWLYQNVAMELANSLQAHIDEHGSSLGFDSDPIAKEALQRFDKQIDSMVAGRIKQSTQTAVAKAQDVQKSNPNGASIKTVPTGAKNLRDLISSAMD